MKITLEQLKAIGWKIDAAGVKELNECLTRFGISNENDIRHFISQCSHESGLGKYTKELANGTAYEGRKDLGNTQPGDGPKYKGAGYIQLTGRANYQALSDYLKDPEVMKGVEYVAVKYPWTSAGFWWFRNNMSKLCCAVPAPSVSQVTEKVNGGQNGLSERELFYKKCCQILTNAAPTPAPSTCFKSLSSGSRGNDVVIVQMLLNAKGYNCGTADGIYGRNTANQAGKFQSQKALVQTGIVDEKTLSLLIK